MYVNSVDAIIGLQYGDEGKGKIAASISRQIDYNCVARYNGGSNAGHSVHFNDRPTLKLHQIPTGIVYKKRGHVGAGTLVNYEKLRTEVLHFQEIMGFNPYDYLTISPKAILVKDKHIVEDKLVQALSQGSTSSGVAPAYASFYNRTANLAKDSLLIHNRESLVKELLHTDRLLLEGAQGWYLNPYQGNYPYTTSSSSHPASAAVTFGFPANKIKNIIGVAKCYETRSGIDPDFTKVLNIAGNYEECLVDNTKYYEKIVELGNEYGVTTGRKRAVRFLDLTRLINSVNDSGTNILVLQKWDILQELAYYYDNSFCFYMDTHLNIFSSLENMIQAVLDILKTNCPELKEILISASPICDIDWNEFL